MMCFPPFHLFTKLQSCPRQLLYFIRALTKWEHEATESDKREVPSHFFDSGAIRRVLSAGMSVQPPRHGLNLHPRVSCHLGKGLFCMHTSCQHNYSSHFNQGGNELFIGERERAALTITAPFTRSVNGRSSYKMADTGHPSEELEAIHAVAV